MKKLFVMAALSVATLTASAQFAPGTISVQPRIGATGSMLSNMPDLPLDNGGKIDATATGGLFFGADLEFMLTDMLSLSAGVNWAQAGSGWKDYKYKENGSTLEVKDLKVQTGYINVPITASVYIVKGLAVRTGVQFSFLTNAKMKCTVTGSASEGGVNYNMNTDIDESCKDDFEKFDVSLPVGLSYEFNNHLVIDARYNAGLLKVNKEKAEKDSKNQVFCLTLGWKLPL